MASSSSAATSAIFQAPDGRFGLRSRAGVVLPARYDAVWPLGQAFFGVRAADCFGIADAAGRLVVPVDLPAWVDGYAPLPADELLRYRRADGTFAENFHRAHPLVVTRPVPSGAVPDAFFVPAALPAERWTPAIQVGPLWVLVDPGRGRQLWLCGSEGTAEWKPIEEAPYIVDFLETGVAVELPAGVEFLWPDDLVQVELLSERRLAAGSPTGEGAPEQDAASAIAVSPAGQALDETTRAWLKGHVEKLLDGRPPLDINQWLTDLTEDMLSDFDEEDAAAEEADDDDDYTLAEYLADEDETADDVPAVSFASRLAAASHPGLPADLDATLRAADIAPAAPVFADLPERAWRLCEVFLEARGLARDDEEADFDAWCAAYPDADSVPPSLIDQLVYLAWLYAHGLIDTTDPADWRPHPDHPLPGPEVTEATMATWFAEYELGRLAAGLRR